MESETNIVEVVPTKFLVYSSQPLSIHVSRRNLKKLSIAAVHVTCEPLFLKKLIY